MRPDEQQCIHFVLTNTKSNTRAARRKARSHSALVAHAHARLRRAATRRQQGLLETSDVGDAPTPNTRYLADGSQHDESHSAENQYSVATTISANDATTVPWLDHNWLTVHLSQSSLLTAGDRFLLHYYITVVIPDMQSHCLQLDYSTSDKRPKLMDFARLSHGDPGFLYGLLLQACRHRYSCHGKEADIQRTATAYKLRCLRCLNTTLAASPSVFSDATVANVMTLALDEMVLGDTRMARTHILGAIKMVNFNGGPQALGLNGFLWYLLQNFVQNKGLFK